MRRRLVLVLVAFGVIAAGAGWSASGALGATLLTEGFNSSDIPNGGLPSGWTSAVGTTGFGNYWHDQISPQNVSVIPAINPALVTLPDSGSLPSAFEGNGAAWFGEASTGTFCGNDPGDSYADVTQTPNDGCNSEQANSGDLISPTVSLSSKPVANGSLADLYPSAQLSFESWWDIEAVEGESFDVMTVSYSTDGGSTWTALGTLNPDNATSGQPQEDYTSGGGIEVPPQWQPYLVDLGPTLTAIQNANNPDSDGGTPGDPTDSVQLKFTFDTGDTAYNGFRGWVLDNVQAAAPYAAGTPTASSASPTCVTPGDASSVITIHGTNIPLGSTVNIDPGTDNEHTVNTTFEPSANALQFTNPGLSEGAHQFQIVTPSGGTSNLLSYTSSSTCLRATSTSVSCSPSPSSVGTTTTCTATVSDADGGTPAPPTGTATFADATTGSCDLAPVANAAGDTTNTPSSSCSTTFAPGATGTSTVAAAYSGDSTFAPSNGQTQLAVQPPQTPSKPTIPSTSTPVVSGSSGASLAGSVDPEGSLTTAHFDIGLDPKYSGGGALTYTQSTPNQTVGSDFAVHNVTASVSGLLPNALYHARLVASNVDGTVDGPDVTFTTGKQAAPGAPTVGKTANVTPVSGLVFVRPPNGKQIHGVRAVTAAAAGSAIPKGQGFIPLTQARQVPVGSQIDALRGTLSITLATGHARKTQAAKLNGSVFNLGQNRSGRLKGLTTFSLKENAFKGAPSYTSCTTKKKTTRQPVSPLAQIAKLSSKVLQTLHASDHGGKFRTKGRYSAATVRGTDWFTEDRCDGTLTKVRRGSVNVQDFRTRKTIVLRAGHSFLAKRF